MQRKDKILKTLKVICPQMKQCNTAHVSVGLLECNTDKDFLELGKAVYDMLMQPKSKRLLVKTKYGTLTVQECIVHGS